MEGPVLPVPIPMSSMWIRVTMLDMEVELRHQQNNQP